MNNDKMATGARSPLPKRSRAATLVPMAIGIVTICLIGWVTWPTMRPVRSVVVSQVVFERSTSVDEIEPGPSAGQPPGPTVQAAGWLEAEPFMIACTALADGVVETIDVLEGDRVDQGQVVARLIDEDAQLRLRHASAQVAAAEAELAIAEAERVAAQRSWDDPIELLRAVASTRAAVAEGEGELAQLPSLVISARATLERLQEEAARIRASADNGDVNELEAIIAEQRVAAQVGELHAVEAREPILRARVDRLRAELAAAERHFELRIADRRRLDSASASLAGSRAEVARAVVARDEAALELDRMTIRAPISGFVQRRLKAPGDKVIRMMDAPDSMQIVHLYDPDRLQVRVDVPLADASHISVGQRCEVVVEILPDRVFAGEVLRITHEADLQKNTLQIKVKVDDPDPVLRPEMLTRVKFLPLSGGPSRADAGTSSLETRVLVESAALDTGSQPVCVWTIAQRRGHRGVLSARTVTIISEADGWATVRGELSPGTLVAMDHAGAREGETVAIRTADGRTGS